MYFVLADSLRLWCNIRVNDVNRLRKSIAKEMRDLPRGKKDSITIADIAKRANVSTTTISRYLNGKYEYMSEKSREKIAGIIKETGYRPNKMARGLKMQQSKIIGFVVADIANPFSSILAKGISDACRQHGYSMTLANTDEDPHRERSAIRSMMDQQVDGIIVHQSGENEAFFRELAKEGAAVIFAERPLGNPPILDAFRTQDDAAIRQMLLCMKEKGYERVGYFTAPLRHFDTRIRRSQAYHTYSREFFGQEPLEYVIDLKQPDLLKEQLKGFLNQSGRLALLTSNGVMTLQVLKALKSLGVQYPRDVGVGSFDDWDWMELADITAIHQPSYELGCACVKRLMERIGQPGLAPALQELPCTLTIRNSL